ncbi:MAG: hypothetical protein ACOYY2_13080 [Actinomycetota bacterium]
MSEPISPADLILGTLDAMIADLTAKRALLAAALEGRPLAPVACGHANAKPLATMGGQPTALLCKDCDAIVDGDGNVVDG